MLTNRSIQAICIRLGFVVSRAKTSTIKDSALTSPAIPAVNLKRAIKAAQMIIVPTIPKRIALWRSKRAIS